MRQLINRLGRGRSIIATTAISTILSNLFTLLMYVIFLEFGVELNLKAAITIATVVCAIITPIISWYMFSLVIEINDLEKEMRQLATSDALTGLLTRRFFFEEARMIYNLALRENFTITAILLDFDGFKSINDRYGHDAGDNALRAFGEIVRKTSRKSDICGRLGGEEFAFLLSHTSIHQAIKYADRFQNEIRKTTIADDNGNDFHFSVSIGMVSSHDAKVDKVEQLFSLADKALYDAKAKGRDQTIVYSSELNGN
jgi:diguanylate cyclase (GGDEF)-like protein